jgi:hypothetical protein
MIGDSLFDAGEQLTRYQQQFVDIYGPLAEELDRVKTVLACAQAGVDGYGVRGLDDAYDQAVLDLLAALRSLDVTPLDHALERLHALTGFAQSPAPLEQQP